MDSVAADGVLTRIPIAAVGLEVGIAAAEEEDHMTEVQGLVAGQF